MSANRRATEPAAPDGTVLDLVALRGVRVAGRHGVHADERRHGQDFVVDAVLSVDTRRAAASDELSDTVDYATLAARIAAVVAGEPVALLETLADRLAAVCLAEPVVREVEITVHKPDAPLGLPFDDVTVTIRRVSAAPPAAAEGS